MDKALADSVLEYHAVRRDYHESVDVVVVGTGCGGMVVAKELARAGHRVLMLERGGFFLPERKDFDQREDNMMARIDGGRGFDMTANAQVALTYGSCVGGASVHYWADSWRTPFDRCLKWELEHHVEGRSYGDLLPLFDRIEHDLNIHPAADDRRNRMNLLYLKGAQSAGLKVERVMQARKGCVGAGYCAQGCAFNAKQSMLVTYVPEALAAGARIFADCQVQAVTMANGRATGVVGEFLDRRTTKPSGHKLTVRARHVVVAAGGFNTAPLLMRSRIPDPSRQLGKNLMHNPCAQVFALFERDIVMWQNVPAAVGTMDLRLHRMDGRRYVEGGYLLYPNQLQPAALAALLPGFGAGHRQLMERAHQLGSTIAWLDDQETGSVELDDEGNPIWNWELKGLDELAARDAMKKGALVLLHAGASEVVLPDAGATRIRDVSELSKVDTIDVGPGSIFFPAPHPAGMCRMGGDPRSSVVASTGEVHAVPGLWVADPSAFPTAVSVDPSVTIMAWSYLTAGHLLRALG